MPDSSPVTDILLATDLGPRCDRALARALSLASNWAAKLHIVMVVEPSGRPSWEDTEIADRAREEIAAIVGGTTARYELLIRHGPVEQAVLDTAADVDCQLVVVGMALNEFLGKGRPGRLVDVLIRQSRVPVLMVKRPATAPYQRLVAPTDFSSVSEAAIARSLALFPSSALSLLHAFTVPFAGFLGPENERAVREAATTQTMSFVHRLGEQLDFASPPKVILEMGSPEGLLAEYTKKQSVDLTVLGVHRPRDRNRHSDDLAGRLLIASSCDVVAVPSPVM